MIDDERKKEGTRVAEAISGLKIHVLINVPCPWYSIV